MEGQYEKAITRILDGVMFHEQMMLYYNFLGLNGYSTCHKYHYLSELNSYNSVLEYYINKYNKLIIVKPNTDTDIIPSSWYKFTKSDVEVSNIRSGVKTGLTKWLEWENGTLEVLKEIYVTVCKEDVTFGVLLQALISDVEDEIKTINENMMKDKATDYDVILMMSEQGELIKKYNKKIKHDIDFTKMGV